MLLSKPSHKLEKKVNLINNATYAIPKTTNAASHKKIETFVERMVIIGKAISRDLVILVGGQEKKGEIRPNLMLLVLNLVCVQFLA